MGIGQSLRKKPLMDYETEMGAKSFYKFGASRVTGWRKSQEDRLIILPDFYKDFSLFAVFDGHGGSEVAEYLAQNYPNHLASFLENNDCELALQLSFLTCDNCLRNIDDTLSPPDEACADDLMEELPDRRCVIPALKAILSNTDSAGTSAEGTESMPDSLRKSIASETLKFLTSADLEPEESDEDDENYDESMESSASEDSDSIQSEDPESEEQGENKASVPESKFNCCGSTGTVILLNQKQAFIANVGDSRCIASVNGKAVELSVDHKPTDIEELTRIKNAGCKVTEDGRINGGLNMSRAFGDFEDKKTDDIEQAIICDPYITTIDVNEELDFIVVASDGIWNSLSNQEVVDYVNIRIKDTHLSDICEELFKFILAPDPYGDGSGCDNMSMAIIEFIKDSEPVTNFHICYNDMELDEDNSEMESHSSHGFADKSSEVNKLDGNTENKNENCDKSEGSNEKHESKDSVKCNYNGVREQCVVLCEESTSEGNQAIHGLHKFSKILQFFCSITKQDPLQFVKEQKQLEENVCFNSEDCMLGCSGSIISASRPNLGNCEKSVRAANYDVQSILYENNPNISYKNL